MKDYRSQYPNREMREFWAINEHEVLRVQGFECQPNGDIWWCPEIGYSVSEQHHLFSTKIDAMLRLKSDLDKQIRELTDARDKLEARIAKATYETTP